MHFFLDPIDSETYSEAVSQCEQMLRLRLRDRTGPHTHENPYESSTALVDVAIAYWVSQDGVFSSAVSPPLPRALSRALHRPLLQALFFQLSEVSFSSGHQSKTSAAAGDGSNAAANTLSLTTIVNLIETCLWSFLQNGKPIIVIQSAIYFAFMQQKKCPAFRPFYKIRMR